MSYTVLLCDDARFSRSMMAEIISEAGFEVVGQAANGEQALEQYHRLHPDLVILDIVMPDMNGLDVVRALHRLDPGVRIVMCSAMGAQHLMDEAAAAGARGYIVKPFSESRVLEVLNEAMA
jgi:two-component system, chemotaxis family, chemotaxis protein CheY